MIIELIVFIVSTISPQSQIEEREINLCKPSQKVDTSQNVCQEDFSDIMIQKSGTASCIGHN